MQKSKHKWQRVVDGAQRLAGSTQRITMVTAIRRLRRVWLGQRGRLERQLTEESSLTLDGSTDNHPPPPLPQTSHPQRPQSLQTRDVASSPFLNGKKKLE